MKTFDFTLADRLIDLALLEDIGPGDITTSSVIEPNKPGRAIIKAKEKFVVCGTEIAQRVFFKIDPGIVFVKSIEDGFEVNKGDVIFSAKGSMASLLKAERTALNFLQRLSGIATNTKKFVEKLKDYPKVRLCDTRKTTPGLRVLEKYAVSCGGAFNHRTGLYDGVLIKDNHIEAAGSIEKAVSSVRKNISHLVKIEVEVKDFEEVNQALEAGADVIMLDNMNTEQIEKACKIINKMALVEVSGNVTANRLPELAKAGADIISCGALIHQAVSVDLSMYLEKI